MADPERVEGDGPGHELTDDCLCLPSIYIEFDDEGNAVEIVVHHAWEGRFR